VGSVNFMDGSTLLGNVALTTTGLTGTAAYTTTPSTQLSATSHTITAVYVPAAPGNFQATSASLTQNVSPAGTTTTLSTSKSPTVYGEPVTFTAHVTANAPSTAMPPGQVSFIMQQGSTYTGLGSGTLNANGVATLTTTALPVGNLTIYAAYSPPNGNFVSSVS